jgi:hypothetical protein
MEKWTRADIRPIERSGEQDIEIEQGKGWNQEIRLVGAPELHRFDPLAFQEKDAGQNHSKQENDREGSKILRHRSLLRSRGEGENNSTLGELLLRQGRVILKAAPGYGRRGYGVNEDAKSVALMEIGGAAMTRNERVSAIVCGVALLLSVGSGSARDIDAKSFRCITKMTPVRQFYMDNLQGNPDTEVRIIVLGPRLRTSESRDTQACTH